MMTPTARLVAPPRLTWTPLQNGSSLRDRFDARHNHLTLIRLGLALTVACVHALAVGFGHQPVIGRTRVGDLAVDAFFILSGFLITASFLRLRSIRRYVWHRFLRIMPGFWTCLVITALIVAPFVAVVQERPAMSVFTAPESSLDYVTANGALLMQQFGIAGLPRDVPEPDVLNGALWTLFYEAVCYAAVILLALLGALRRRPYLTLFAATGLWAVTVAQALGFTLVGQERMLRLALLFLIGCVTWLYADRIPVHGALAVAAGVILLAALLVFHDYRVFGAPAFAYLWLWLAVQRPPKRPSTSDLSYGLYIYHWPVQSVLVATGAAAWGEATFLALSLAIALTIAAGSWRLVEQPSLRWKNAVWIERAFPTAALRFRATAGDSDVAPSPDAA
jgi:peptidoglycan/LPS O-acetylase OafA/YrhL